MEFFDSFCKKQEKRVIKYAGVEQKVKE